MASANESRAQQLRSATQQLQTKIAAASKDVSNERQKAIRAGSDARSTKSETTARSKMRNLERAETAAQRAESRRADLEKQLAAKQSQLHDAERRVAEDQRRATEKQVREQNRQFDTQQRLIDQMTQASRLRDNEVRRTVRGASQPDPAVVRTGRGSGEEYDFFICHAGEDKEEVARPLADLLAAKGVRVWYDAFVLRVGDSLRRIVDRGLASSRFGVVILSPAFFGKGWPEHELDGLVTREIASGRKVVLPLWHHVTKDEVQAYSPTLADKMALNTAVNTIQEIADLLHQEIGRLR